MEVSLARATKLLPELATIHRLIGLEGTWGELNEAHLEVLLGINLFA